MEGYRVAGSLIALTGSLFLFLGALGVWRMPDVYNRMQTGTKSTTLGSILTLFGLGVYQPEWMGQMLILMLFIAVTNPISSHALARAAHHTGVPLTQKSVMDELEEDVPLPTERVLEETLSEGEEQ
ncbi:MAG TPA: Na+/H+ antiporter subunit G [Caldithrix abyssi]|uniref:Na+/H+ antiporter subunit G n=1 Tax=Caldithrix abyssi TaxID=187145 RepID=A0A7V1LPG0_CALAY|nr:Na+/H+ antiporter subunit G [Caldithrix abyssi]